MPDLRHNAWPETRCRGETWPAASWGFWYPSPQGSATPKSGRRTCPATFTKLKGRSHDIFFHSSCIGMKRIVCFSVLRKYISTLAFSAVLRIRIRIRIRIHRIHMFLGLLDPDPDPSVRGMDPDPAPDLDPSITKQKSKKNPNSYCFVTSFWLFIFENDVHVPSKSNKQKNF